MALSPQWLDELRSRITLSGVIGRTTRLQKAGREFKACCPFHNEKTPSFTVNDEKGFYHCFGCGAHGDAIRWLTDQRGMPFIDAVKELAAEAGMEVPAPDPRAAQAAEQRASLHDVMAAAQAWFVDNLAADIGREARGYLERRGIGAGAIREFGFGYAPDDRGAIAEALSGFPKEMLIEAGLLIDVEGKQPYDRFRGRLMLPIQDRRGRVIAFGGRILVDAPNAPKYLNSPDTPVFDKGRTLYNLHRAAAASRQTDRVIVVEGYMDVVALAGAGIDEAVAPMGTALTENQIELLWRLVPVPVLCFDGDAAGQRAAMRAIERALPMLRPGHSLSIVTLPEGLDPDDLIRRSGKDSFVTLLGQGENLVDALWKFEFRAEPLDTPEDKAGLKARLLSYVEKIQHPDIRSLYRRELLDRFGMFAFPKREFGEKVTPIGVARVRRARRLSMRDHQERLHRRLGAALVAGFLNYPEQLDIYREKLGHIHPDDIDPRLDAMLQMFESNKGSLLRDLHNAGFVEPAPREFDFLNFAFNWPVDRHGNALTALMKAVTIYVDLPAIEDGLWSHTLSMTGENFNDETFEEQQRIRRRKDTTRELVRIAVMRMAANER